ncbi:MAG: carbon-nitrogen hydrolase family protein [Blastocatellia bacterium]|nr:carbon-nitrogen hydrolase family protein [Blastocatellia bacterium]
MMPQSTTSNIVVVAAVQAAPVYMNLERSLARAVELTAEAARRRAQLVVFPESWLAGYPAWLDNCRDVAVWDHLPVKQLYARLLENSLTIPDRNTAALSDAARRHGLTLVIGAHERVGGTIYNSTLTFGPDGSLLNVHRKLVPTFNERLIWGQGDGAGLRVVDTPVGRIGSLICWEHWMPLVRQKLHAEREEIHIAQWPAVKEMYQIASRHYAFEGRCFVVAAGAIMRRSDLPPELELAAAAAGNENEYILNGGSAVIGPDGQYVAGPAFASEVIILARINLDRIQEESLTLDVTGHFHRPDLFDFRYKGPQEIPSTTEEILIDGEAIIELPKSQALSSGQLTPGGAEVLLPGGTEVLSPLEPHSPPSFRVISSSGNSGRVSGSGYTSEIHEIEKHG